VVVEIPSRSPVKFQDINDDDDAYSPPPTPKTRKEPEPQPKQILVQIEVFRIACEKCQKGGRDCVPVVGNGDACRDCKFKKYRCTHRGRTDIETMWVTRPAIQMGSEVNVVEDTKGKKRKAESPVPATKRKASVKEVVEKVEKPKKTRETKVKAERPRAQQPKASGSKAVARRRAPPKSSPIIEDSSGEEFEGIDEEESDEEPKPKRARVRLMPGKKFFFKK
jgi:hypothetical protein